MKKAFNVLFMLLICLSVSAQIPEQYKIHIIDKLIFQNNTPFDIEDLQVVVQDPMAYTTSAATYKIKIPSMQSVDYPLLTGEKQKLASQLTWSFNERTLPQLLHSSQAFNYGPGYVVYNAMRLEQEHLLKSSILLEINILEAVPVWCTKDKKRQKCEGKFTIQRDSKIPYKFIINQV